MTYLMSVNHLKLFFFADDTNLTALGQADFLINETIRKLNYWLKANKPIINVDKTVQLNVKSSSSSSMTFQFNNCDTKTEPVC